MYNSPNMTVCPSDTYSYFRQYMYGSDIVKFLHPSEDEAVKDDSNPFKQGRLNSYTSEYLHDAIKAWAADIKSKAFPVLKTVDTDNEAKMDGYASSYIQRAIPDTNPKINNPMSMNLFSGARLYYAASQLANVNYMDACAAPAAGGTPSADKAFYKGYWYKLHHENARKCFIQTKKEGKVYMSAVKAWQKTCPKKK